MSSSPAPVERGLLVVVSAPSGTGKTTVVNRLIELRPRLRRSLSYTSRPPHDGEAEGVDYNFVSRDAFDRMVEREEFLEWANIFGHCYGTSRRSTEAALVSGADLILVIDVQGARQVRQRVRDAVAIFVLPPSYGELVKRLQRRNRDSPAAMATRLATARAEVSAIEEYDYVVVNNSLDQCVGEIDAIVTAERVRLDRRRATVVPIISTFAE